MHIYRKLTFHQKLLTVFFAGIACLLLLPTVLYGVRNGHDINFHLMLFLSYKDGVQLGELYPRWLPDQLHGLGSPALLLYPPLSSAFFVFIDLLTFHTLPPERVLGLGGFLLSAASACTFFIWAKKPAGKQVALLASLFYATAPYHLNIDLYLRGAMAEYATFVWIPLIFFGIRTTISDTSVKGYVALIVGTTALMLTHLLTVILIAPLAVAYALVCLRQAATAQPRSVSGAFLWVSGGAILAASLAAFYYIPAVSLLQEANPGALQRDVAASNIFSLFPAMTDRFRLRLFILASIYLALFVYLLTETVAKWRKERSVSSTMMQSFVWIGAGFVCFALMSGAFPFLFRPPSPYAQVQFGWRLLVVMEFSLVSLFVSMVPLKGDDLTNRRWITVTAGGFLLLVTLQFADVAVRFSKHTMLANPMQETDEVKWRLSPVEYFPSGSKIVQRPEEAMLPFEKYATAKAAAFIDVTKGKIESADRFGSTFRVRSVTAEATPVSIQQFYFAGWAATDENGKDISVFRTQDVPLVTYIAPAGDHTVTISRVQTKQERWGNMISLMACVVTALSLLFLIWRRKR